MQEYLEGQSLRERLKSGALPLDEALDLAVEVGEALIAAHKAGIIHRDLKPDNIFVTEEGHAKMLDFGLAKLTEAAAPTASSASMASTMLGTVAGQVMGTAGYMAPEQVEGARGVDHRADLFAFGCVLYEMATGRRAFAGTSTIQTLNMIAHEEPEPATRANGKLPVQLDWILEKCLAIKPGRRYQHTEELSVDLLRLRESAAAGVLHGGGPGPAEVQDAAGPGVSWQVAALAAVALVALGFFAARWLGPARSAPVLLPPSVSFDIALPEGRWFPRGDGTNIALSPDGRALVYVADDESGRRLYLRRLAEPGFGEAIPQTEGGVRPTFSPDGKWIAFADGRGGLIRVSLESGERYPICDGCENASWTADGFVYFNRFSSLWRVAAVGGEPEPVVEPGDDRWQGGMLNPVVLPNGKGVVFENSLFEFGGIGVLPLDGGPVIPVSDRGSGPRYSATGHILFSRGSAVIAVPFDIDVLIITGPAAPVLPSVRLENGGAVQLAVAEAGVLAFEPGGTSGTQLIWADRSGETQSLNTDWHIYRSPRVSSDGRHIAVTRNDDGATDVWVVDVASGGMRRLTTSGDVRAPEWSPDASSIVFGSRTTGGFALQLLRLDGTASAETLLTSEHRLRPESWHPEGDLLVFSELSTSSDLYVYDFRDGSRRELVTGAGSVYAAKLSHNGKALTYESDEGGGFPEVYVRPFPGPGVPIPVSVGGGTSPVWSAADASLFYIDGGHRLRTVSVHFDPALEVVGQQPLFSVSNFWTVFSRAHYDLAPDGRFLFLKEGGESGGRIRLVLNWFEELKQRAPTGR
ncbi:MAG: protein kinase [Acidobacteriota bacterium]